MTPNDLGAYDRNHQNDSLVFVFTELQHGFFALKNAPATPVMNVTQLKSVTAPSSLCTMARRLHRATRSRCVVPALHGQALSQLTLHLVVFLENNQLIINQGQMITLTVANLKATYANKVDGRFELLGERFSSWAIRNMLLCRTSLLSCFNNRTLLTALVRFVHDQSLYAPAYRIAVSNGAIKIPPQPAGIDFDTIPLLLTNQLVINQGQSVLLTAAMLNATHPGSADSSYLQF